MNNFNSLLNFWDFEQDPYVKKFDIIFPEILEMSSKYKNCYVKINWRSLIYKLPLETYSIELISNNQLFAPIKVSGNSNVVIDLKFFEHDLKLKLSIDFNKFDKFVAKSKTDSFTESKRTHVIYEITKEFFIAGSDTSGPLKYLLQGPTGKQVFRVDGNKIKYPKFVSVLKYVFPKFGTSFNNQQIYPIIDEYVKSRIDQGIVSLFEIIHKDHHEQT